MEKNGILAHLHILCSEWKMNLALESGKQFGSSEKDNIKLLHTHSPKYVKRN